MKYYADTSFIAPPLEASDARPSLAVATIDFLPPLPGLPLKPFRVLELRNIFARLERQKILHRAESKAFMQGGRTDSDAGFLTAAPLHV